ncbi:lipocalin family protein [Gillisia sp. M10.2A]|uniref:Type IV secretion system putative lipoprotein virB7 n=1 Tax=Gillisia lutea TaxID=2909668 RepID=A0ABS9EEK3_9FLAO|nr:lipocalin family protein [Gillisia lutea]MCF4101276.1 lipocalin family protein [Gillisia lutea]
MKKYLVLFFSIAVLAACSNDDDNVSEENDPILGVWYVSELNANGAFTLSECNKESFINFMADKSANSEFYAESDGSCELEDSDSSVWSNEGDSTYKFVIPFEGIGAQTGKVEFNGDGSFTFSPVALPGSTVVFEKR